ncbi:DUF2125 domain-containing protein [Oceaniglobus trochenteri]|uniref:DUF2125 domain-containing protein n=1 Tax=Oceaniglobus trochenteri TaxID=2763260 RepID=UPI001CFF6EC5|nr:DUF2125 domain-containing protein [Oceaniglobus trochenteri]
MRKLLAIVLIAALAWGGYWFFGSGAVERGLAAWFDARRADGWVAEYSGLNTSGFPSRFDTTITDLELADPQAGLAWSAQMFQILALSYKPHHVILALPHDQSVTTPHETISITSTQMRGSVVFKPETALTLDHSAFVMQDVALTSDLGWTVQLDEARLAARQTVARDNTYDLAFETLGLVPADSDRQALDPSGTLPRAVETLKIDATLAFDAPWDRFAIEGPRPQPTMIELNHARASWGALDLRAEGALEVDAGGVPTGRITIQATNWREMLRMAVAGGLLDETLAPTVERGLTVLSGLSGDGTTIEVPLSFQKGFVSIGPVPLGPAPRLTLR